MTQKESIMNSMLTYLKYSDYDVIAMQFTRPAIEIIVQALDSAVKIDKIENEVAKLRDNYEQINNPWGDRWEYSNPYDAVLKLFKSKQD